MRDWLRTFLYFIFVELVQIVETFTLEIEKYAF